MSADPESTNGAAPAEEEELPEEVRYWLEWMNRHGEQDENGVDWVRLQANLRLTPTERLLHHERAARFMLEVDHGARASGLRRLR